MYYKRLLRIALCAVVVLLSSCATTHEIMLADFISFSDDAETSYNRKSRYNQGKPYILYEGETKNKKGDVIATGKGMDRGQISKMTGKLKSVARLEGENTAGYYALDLGLERVKYVRKKILKKDKLTKFYIIYITDGLDNISVQTAKNNKRGSYKTLDAYIKKLNKRKSRLMGSGKDQQCFQIYPLGLIGEDMKRIGEDNTMSKEELTKWMSEYMEGFRGSSKGWETPEVTLADSWDTLQKEFIEKFTSSRYQFYIPKGYLNKRVRMTLTDEEEGNQTFVEGTYKKKGGKYILADVELKENLVSNTAKNGPEYEFEEIKAFNNANKKDKMSWFAIENLSRDGKPYKVYLGNGDRRDPKAPRQQFQEVNDKDINKKHSNNAAGERWIFNSEYDGKAHAGVNTYVLFIADVSKSIGEVGEEDGGKVKEATTLQEIFDVIKSEIPQQ
ncbi:MAG: hypothetical protein J6V13_06870 [Paludibacteraceae bacterium]|nr:hypothetical protein [Paludibacteraceae bacterium]